MYRLRRILGYSVASTADSAFIIGGWNGGALSTIAKFSDNQWSLHGHLHHARDSHGSITFAGLTMVTGGYSVSIDYYVLGEVWNLAPKANISVTLDGDFNRGAYSFGWGLYLVDVNFCQN